MIFTSGCGGMWRKFLDATLVVNCEAWDEAMKFLDVMDKRGMRWMNGDSCLKCFSIWGSYSNFTAFVGYRMHDGSLRMKVTYNEAGRFYARERVGCTFVDSREFLRAVLHDEIY